MDANKKTILKRFAYAASANLISLLVSVITTLLIPKFLGAKVDEYGYLQLYLFYTSYVGFLHFGWVDGILLREGGKNYRDLGKELYAAEYRLFILFEAIVSALIVTATGLMPIGSDKRFVLDFTAANVLIMLMRAFLQYVLQATNRIKEYSITASAGRVLYLVSCCLVMLMGFKTYKLFVILDTICKLLSLMLTIYYCKDLVLIRKARLIDSAVLREIREKTSAGIKLVFANIASMLMTGIVRQGIENQWDIATFGKVSLTLSISNFFITFISAVSIVLFPTLRTLDKARLPSIYHKISNILSLVAFGLIGFYYPLRLGLSVWLPRYSDGLMYMAILFPMCFYLSKVTLLIQTYYQVLRYEKDLMAVNILSLLISVVTALISVGLLHNLTLAVLSILINQAIRCILAEARLAKKTGLRVVKNIATEACMVFVFVMANWLVEGWIGFGIYAAAYLIFLYISRDQAQEFIHSAKEIIKRKKG